MANKSSGAGGGAVYGIGFVGAAVFYFQQADTFWSFVLALMGPVMVVFAVDMGYYGLPPVHPRWGRPRASRLNRPRRTDRYSSPSAKPQTPMTIAARPSVKNPPTTVIASIVSPRRQ